MKKRIWVIDEEWPDYDLESRILLEKYPDAEIRFSDYNYTEDLEIFGKNADAILAQVYAPLPAEVIDKLENCRIIAVYGGGYDRVDTKAAKEKGIVVTNVSGYCAEDLGDYVMAAIYASNKHFLDASPAIKTGKWGAESIKEKGIRLSSSKLFIIGLGHIGTTVARKAQIHGLKVYAYDPYVSEEEMAKKNVRKLHSIEEGFALADYVSVNAILTEETTGLITYNHLKRLKSSAYLINTARGRIFVEEDLIRAVEEKLFAGAMLDVISAEPPTYKEAIFHCGRIRVTPHISYISQNSFDELKRRAAGNVITVLGGGVPEDWVNP